VKLFGKQRATMDEYEQQEDRAASERIGSAVLTIVVLLVVAVVLALLSSMPAQWCFALPALFALVFRSFFMYNDEG
jgi:cobalamin biosynthesis protein CobD/CbiB